MTVTHYTRSTGESVEIATMEHSHLVSAYEKLRRTDASVDQADVLDAMKAQIDANEIVFGEQQQKLEAAGWAVEPFTYEGKTKWIDGYRATGPQGQEILCTREPAAWREAWLNHTGGA